MSDDSKLPSLDVWDFNTSEELETDGVWVTDCGVPGVHLRLRSVDVPAAQEMLRRLLKRQRSVIKALGTVPAKMDEANTVQLLVEVLCVDWEGVTYPPGHAQAGQPMPCTPDTRRLLFSKHRPVRDAAWASASSTELFTQRRMSEEVRDEVTGN